ncbi:MAG: LemA family protein [Candidatus Nomurabacteria bacterium]|jgi:LemA protein|nr:LemA family protein [Candidatus Nomurabacteria bacterium]
MMWLWIIIGVVVLLLLVIWGIYNSLVRLNVRVDEAWSDITVQLKYRADLIPNLVETVKAYAKHEKEAFENVTKARAGLLNPSANVKAAAEAENAMTKALSGLFAIAENYPDLKANQNFAELQRQLQEVEDKIQAARRFYNGGVKDLNTKVKLFPSNIFASMLGFKVRDFFEVEDRAAVENAPEVKFE